MKTAITGANGQLGRLVVEQLKNKTGAEQLVALVRTPAAVSDLGVETRVFDYSKADALPSALAGVDTLLLISGNEMGQRVEQHQNVIRAAKAAGVKRIVYTSLLRADQSSLILAAEHLATEEAVKASGIPYTILRNGWYTENYTASVPGAVKAGAFIGSAGEGKISSAARKDYAEAAAVVLTTAGHEGKVYELAGDEAYTLRELAAELSRQTGKDIPYRDLPEADYAATLKQIGLPEAMASAFASFDTGAARGDLYSEKNELSGLIGRPTTPLRDVLKVAVS